MDLVIILDYSIPNFPVLGGVEVTSLEEWSAGQACFEACTVACFGRIGTGLARASSILEALLASRGIASLAVFED
jgi:hypothetical protein